MFLWLKNRWYLDILCHQTSPVLDWGGSNVLVAFLSKPKPEHIPVNVSSIRNQNVTATNYKANEAFLKEAIA